MQNGFVIEFNIRDQNGKIYPDILISSKNYGQEIFDELTNNESVGSVFIEKDISGLDSEFGFPVLYDRAFVILP